METRESSNRVKVDISHKKKKCNYWFIKNVERRCILRLKSVIKFKEKRRYKSFQRAKTINDIGHWYVRERIIVLNYFNRAKQNCIIRSQRYCTTRFFPVVVYIFCVAFFHDTRIPKILDRRAVKVSRRQLDGTTRRNERVPYISECRVQCCAKTTQKLSSWDDG